MSYETNIENPKNTPHTEAPELGDVGVTVEFADHTTLPWDREKDTSTEAGTILEQKEFKEDIEPFTAEVEEADRLFVGAVGAVAVGAVKAGRVLKSADAKGGELLDKGLEIGVAVAGKAIRGGFRLAVKGMKEVKERTTTMLETKRGKLFEKNIEKYADQIQARLKDAKLARVAGMHEDANGQQAAIAYLVNMAAETPRGYRWAHKLGLMDASVNHEGVTDAYNSAVHEVAPFDIADLATAEAAKAAGDTETYQQALLKIRDGLQHNYDLGVLSEEVVTNVENYVMDRVDQVKTPEQVQAEADYQAELDAYHEDVAAWEEKLLEPAGIEYLQNGIAAELLYATSGKVLAKEDLDALRAELTIRHLTNYIGGETSPVSDATISKIVALVEQQRTQRQSQGKRKPRTSPGPRTSKPAGGRKPGTPYRRLTPNPS